MAVLKGFVTKCHKQRKFHEFENSSCKVWQKVITRCDSYKVRQLLQSETKQHKYSQFYGAVQTSYTGRFGVVCLIEQLANKLA